MALTPMREDLNIISRLDDEPNDTQGLTPAELKARFDLAGNRIQAYINDTLLPEVEDAIESRVPASRRICGKTLERDVALTARDVGALPEDTPIPATLADLAQDPEHRTVTDAEKAAWNAKSTLALGETASTAYRGDRGKIAYDHSQAAGNPHGTTPADIGAVPATRKVNGKPLSADVSLSASDVGAAAAAHVHGNLTSDGRIGSMAGRAVFTGEQGLLQAGVLPLSAGGTGASTAAAARAALGAAAFLAGTAVLEPGWTGPNGQGYYTRTVSAQGVLASDWVDVTRVLDLSDKSASDQVQAAWDKVAECAVGEGVLTFYAPEDINTAIPVAWKVVR